MGNVTAAQLKAIARQIEIVRIRHEAATMGGTSFVIVDDDGRVPPIPPSQLLILVQPIPSGKFLKSATPVKPEPLIVRKVGKGVWQHRRIGVTMCRRYIEFYNPAIEWEYFAPLLDLIDAPTNPNTETSQSQARFVAKDNYGPNLTAEEERKTALALIEAAAASRIANADKYAKDAAERAAILAAPIAEENRDFIPTPPTPKAEVIVYRNGYKVLQ